MTAERLFCTHCGAENRAEDKLCAKCGKELNGKENLFRDFLTDHIKDKIKGKIGDGIFDALKGWLLSHLYGCLVTVSLIAVIGTGIAAVTSAPARVKQRPVAIEEYGKAADTSYTDLPVGTLDLTLASLEYFRYITETVPCAIDEGYMQAYQCTPSLSGVTDAYVIHRPGNSENEDSPELYDGSYRFSDGTSVSVTFKLYGDGTRTVYKYRDETSCTVFPDGRVEGQRKADIYK